MRGGTVAEDLHAVQAVVNLCDRVSVRCDATWQYVGRGGGPELLTGLSREDSVAQCDATVPERDGLLSGDLADHAGQVVGLELPTRASVRRTRPDGCEVRT